MDSNGFEGCLGQLTEHETKQCDSPPTQPSIYGVCCVTVSTACRTELVMTRRGLGHSRWLCGLGSWNWLAKKGWGLWLENPKGRRGHC